MATPVYDRSSPYYTTSAFGQFLDIIEYRPITRQLDDVAYVIDRIYEYRPDLLAFDLYGNAGLWWVFRARNPNVLDDPIFDFTRGTSIYIPTKETLVENLGI